jgi:hypothetical protein
MPTSLRMSLVVIILHLSMRRAGRPQSWFCGPTTQGCWPGLADHQLVEEFAPAKYPILSTSELSGSLDLPRVLDGISGVYRRDWHEAGIKGQRGPMSWSTCAQAHLVDSQHRHTCER